MISPKSSLRARLRLCVGLGVAALLVVTAPRLVDAQGLVKGVEQGAREGNKAAGPVGGVLGGAIGGVVGVVGGVVNTVTGDRRPLRDGFFIRRAATERRIPVYTSLDTLRAALTGLALDDVPPQVRALTSCKSEVITRKSASLGESPRDGLDL